MRHFFQAAKYPYTINRVQPGRDLKLNPNCDFFMARPRALSFLSFHLLSLRQGVKDLKLNPLTALALLVVYFTLKTVLTTATLTAVIVGTVIYLAYRVVNCWVLKWFFRLFAVFWSGMVFYTTYLRITAGQDPCKIRMLQGFWDPGMIICGHVPVLTSEIMWLADVLIVLAPVWLILFVQLTQEPFYRFHLYLSEKIITPLLGLGDPLKFMYAVAGSRHPEGTRAAAGNGR